jgi:alpha-galactosidase
MIRKSLFVMTGGVVAPRSKKQKVALQTLKALQGGTIWLTQRRCPVKGCTNQIGRCIRRIVATLIAAGAVLAAMFSVPQAARASVTPNGPPVMGYNPYYWSPAGVTEATVLEQAHLLVSTGLAKAGYDGVFLDNGWMVPSRTASGALTWNTADFPDGIPWLAAQVHALWLKFGLYESAGPITCTGLPGSEGYYTTDAKTFASWGVDFAKIDQCGWASSYPLSARTADFEEYGTALRAAKPGIVYSEELPVAYTPGTADWVTAIRASASFAHMWRVADDERPTTSTAAAAILSHPAVGEQATATAASTILGHLADDLHLHGFAGPGHWNDLDMLVGASPLFGWTLTQQESQLSVWAEEASPLILSADIATLTGAELSALKNPYMIAIDQSGEQAPHSYMAGTVEALVKPYPGGGADAVLLANLGTAPGASRFPLSDFGISARTVGIYDIWSGRTAVMDHFAYYLNPGQTALLRVW